MATIGRFNEFDLTHPRDTKIKKKKFIENSRQKINESQNRWLIFGALLGKWDVEVKNLKQVLSLEKKSLHIHILFTDQWTTVILSTRQKRRVELNDSRIQIQMRRKILAVEIESNDRLSLVGCPNYMMGIWDVWQ